MKQILKLIACILSSGIITFISCKKENGFQNQNPVPVNKPPIARAGADLAIVLSKDSVLLDGGASTDPDGKITTYEWHKIAGPSQYNIVHYDNVKTIVRIFIKGIYLFELQVTG